MTHRPIEGGFHSEPEEPASTGEGVSADEFREALSYHAAGVTIVSVRDDATVYGTTVTSFTSISADPPVIMVSVGGNAQVLPFLKEGRRFVVNLLRPAQRRLATIFADSYPVGPTPFAEAGDPIVEEALASLTCTVRQAVAVETTRVVLGTVVETRTGDGNEALVHFRRDYHALPGDETDGGSGGRG